MTTEYTAMLHEYEDEDIFDVVVKLEKSFGLCLPKDAFYHVKTFGELCAVFELYTIPYYQHRNDCTSQQAFYRVREAISNTLQIDKSEIMLDSQLAQFFPKQNRRRNTKAFQAGLGIKVNMLTYPDWLGLIFIIGMLASVVAFFFDWKIALGGLAFFIAAIKIADRIGKNLSVDDVKELTQQLVQENYIDIRRRKGTVNRKEITQTIVNTFSRHFDIEPKNLTPDAKFGWA